MFRLIGTLIAGVLLSGLAIALLAAFNWDIVALVEWAFGLTSSLVGMVAEWFTNAPWFQDIVSR